MGSHGAHEKVGRILAGRLCRGIAFAQSRDLKRSVTIGPLRECAQIGHRAIHLFPEQRPFLRAHQWKCRARHDGNIRSSYQFKQAQRMRDFLIPPRVARHHRHAQHVNVGRLQQDQERHHVGAARTSSVLIEDDHSLSLRPCRSAQRKQCRANVYAVSKFHARSALPSALIRQRDHGHRTQVCEEHQAQITPGLAIRSAKLLPHQDAPKRSDHR